MFRIFLIIFVFVGLTQASPGLLSTGSVYGGSTGGGFGGSYRGRISSGLGYGSSGYGSPAASYSTGNVVRRGYTSNTGAYGY